jgi:two-component system, OmpR family, response regulator AdeR
MKDDPLAVVVDDEPLIADIFCTALSKAGYRTQSIGDGLEAVERLPSLCPDLVILDLHLPGMPGIQVLQAIRSDHCLEHTKIVVVSADATLTQYLRDEADLVLVKPVGFHQLRDLAIRLREA